MEGFDKTLINNLYAYEPFQKAFGEQLPDGSWQVTTPWQSALSNAALIGEILGLFINGIAAERFGYRKTMISALIAVIGFIFIVFFAENPATLLVGSILCGIPWGEFPLWPARHFARSDCLCRRLPDNHHDLRR